VLTSVPKYDRIIVSKGTTHRQKEVATMKTYEEKVYISHEHLDEINKMLSSCSDEDVIERSVEEVYSVTFKDGSGITYEVVGNGECFYDRVYFITKDGEEIALDSEYELDDMSIEIDGVEYCVKIIEA